MFIKKIKKLFHKPILGYFYVHLADHCNLNCKYCNHFSPIAKENYIDINKLEKDLIRINQLVDLKAISLMGGEPLLSPNINEIIKLTRKILKKTRISILTNGILLPEKNNEFWEICSKTNTWIFISRVPIKIDIDKIFQLAKKFNVNLELVDGDLNNYKKMYKPSIDLKGTQNPKEMHNICWQYKGGCRFFDNGKLYQCTTAGQIHRLSDYFNLNIYPSEEDYIDIYKVKNGKEIIEFLNKEIPFCKYCNLKGEIQNLDFEISKKELSEWT